MRGADRPLDRVGLGVGVDANSTVAVYCIRSALSFRASVELLPKAVVAIIVLISSLATPTGVLNFAQRADLLKNTTFRLLGTIIISATAATKGCGSTTYKNFICSWPTTTPLTRYPRAHRSDSSPTRGRADEKATFLAFSAQVHAGHF